MNFNELSFCFQPTLVVNFFSFHLIKIFSYWIWIIIYCRFRFMNHVTMCRRESIWDFEAMVNVLVIESFSTHFDILYLCASGVRVYFFFGALRMHPIIFVMKRTERRGKITINSMILYTSKILTKLFSGPKIGNIPWLIHRSARSKDDSGFLKCTERDTWYAFNVVRSILSEKVYRITTTTTKSHSKLLLVQKKRKNIKKDWELQMISERKNIKWE